jgi:hypothetical protein
MQDLSEVPAMHDGSFGGVFLVRASRLWFTGGEHRRGRECLPAALPQRDYFLKVRLSPLVAFHYSRDARTSALPVSLEPYHDYELSLRSLKQRSTTEVPAYASSVAPASLNRITSPSAW